MLPVPGGTRPPERSPRPRTLAGEPRGHSLGIGLPYGVPAKAQRRRSTTLQLPSRLRDPVGRPDAQ